MEAKDIITLTISSLALIVSFTSLWRAILADRQSSKVAFEQQRHEALELFLENQLSHEARLRKLSQLRAQVPASSYARDDLDHFVAFFENFVSYLEHRQEQLRELPPSTLGSKYSDVVGVWLSEGRQQKMYAAAWNRLVAEYIPMVHEIVAQEAGIEEMDMDIEAAEEEIQQKEEKLRRLMEQLSELSQSADTPEEVTPENEDEDIPDEDEDIPDEDEP